MYQIQNGLAPNSENFAKIHVIEYKAVSYFLMTGWRKTRGEKMKVTANMLLKTNVEKMSIWGQANMLMKLNEL